jgi:hypothetical protein
MAALIFIIALSATPGRLLFQKTKCVTGSKKTEWFSECIWHRVRKAASGQKAI